MAVRRRSVLRSPKRRRLKSRENTITTSVIVPIALHEDEGAWWQSPVVLGAIVLALTLVLYLIFA